MLSTGLEAFASSLRVPAPNTSRQALRQKPTSDSARPRSCSSHLSCGPVSLEAAEACCRDPNSLLWPNLVARICRLCLRGLPASSPAQPRSLGNKEECSPDPARPGFFRALLLPTLIRSIPSGFQTVSGRKGQSEAFLQAGDASSTGARLQLPSHLSCALLALERAKACTLEPNPLLWPSLVARICQLCLRGLPASSPAQPRSLGNKEECSPDPARPDFFRALLLPASALCAGLPSRVPDSVGMQEALLQIGTASTSLQLCLARTMRAPGKVLSH